VSVLPERLNLEEIQLMKNQLYLVGNKTLEIDQQNWRKQLEELTWFKRESG
jgi:hypothetical protein